MAACEGRAVPPRVCGLADREAELGWCQSRGERQRPSKWPVSSDSVSDQRSLCSRLEVTKRPFSGILLNSTRHRPFPGVSAFSTSCLSERKLNDKTFTGLRPLAVQLVLDHNGETGIMEGGQTYRGHLSGFLQCLVFLERL